MRRNKLIRKSINREIDIPEGIISIEILAYMMYVEYKKTFSKEMQIKTDKFFTKLFSLKKEI